MKLILEDGTVVKGKSFGFQSSVEGEVVFNTGMTGYVETLTDPSYKGQILVCTYPLQGNYGVPEPVEKNGLLWPYESDKIQVLGLVVAEYSEKYSHYEAQKPLGKWLSENRVPALTGVDTRALTRILREKGTMQGKLINDDNAISASSHAMQKIDMGRVVDIISRKTPKEYLAVGSGVEGRNLRVALVDCGVKSNIIRSLIARGVDVLVVPWNYDLPSIYDNVDGYLISNGAGDPKDVKPLIENTRALLRRKKPVLGICLGHQVLALSAGADTYKMPYGHRSQNQPVQDLYTRRCYITSQNHGYAVKNDSIPDGWDVWFINLNDETNEGIRCLNGPFASVQFHPEASPGPTETSFLFDEFTRLLAQSRSLYDR